MTIRLGEVLFSKYKITKALGEGGFAEVFEVKNITDGQHLAIKSEKQSCDSQTIDHEAVILSKLATIPHIPRVLFLKKTPKFSYLGMTLLGRSLYTLRKAGEFLPTTENLLIVAYQLLNIIEDIHRKGIVHMDIKPDNLVLGRGKKPSLFLIDFGIAVDISQRVDRPSHLLGNPLFCSTRQMEKRPVAKKDDLESWFYSLCFLSNWRLPWDQAAISKEAGWKQTVINSKRTCSAESLCPRLPPEMAEILNYIRALHVLDRPSYGFIRGLIELAAERAGVDLKGEISLVKSAAVPSASQIRTGNLKSLPKSTRVSVFLHGITAEEHLASSEGKVTAQDSDLATLKNDELLPTLSDRLRAKAIQQKRRGSACE